MGQSPSAEVNRYSASQEFHLTGSQIQKMAPLSLSWDRAIHSVHAQPTSWSSI